MKPTTSSNVQLLARPTMSAPFFGLATVTALQTWSKMPWRWLYQATNRMASAETMAMWERAPDLPRLIAKMALGHALRVPVGTPGADPGGETVEFWIVQLEVITLARRENREGHGTPEVHRYLNEALKRFYDPLPASGIRHRLGGISGPSVVRVEDVRAIERLRRKIRAKFPDVQTKRVNGTGAILDALAQE